MATKKKKQLTLPLDPEIITLGVWTHSISSHHLPRPLYFQTANALKKGAYEGFGSPLIELEFGKPDYELLSSLRTNIYMFSAAKTFQQVRAMEKLRETSDAMVKEDRIATFKEFKEAAGEIYEQYNVNYLRTEFNTAQLQARNAQKWNQIQARKQVLPLLRYHAVMDAHTCEICAPLDGIVLPADDPFWNDFYPENHFSCKCTVQQGDREDFGPDSEDLDELMDETRDRMDGEFLMNAGRDKVVFKEEGPNKHPYFDVERGYQNLARNNFNLPIPNED